MRPLTRTALALYLASLSGACTTAADKPPAGLSPVADSGFREMYTREGTDWSSYTAVALLDCTVEFRKNWQRDQNDDIPFSVTDQDVERIKATLAKEFRTVFSQEFADSGEKVVTDSRQGVLVLRPAIVELDVIAPDTYAIPNEVTLADSAGSMTLFLEIYDAANNQLLARIVDPKDSLEFGNFRVRNDVTNLNDARRVLKKWATLLGNFLNAARQPTGASQAAGATR